ncbi:glutathione S-transferase C-terminal domain-containing protein [Corynebacterium sp. 153RC1]|uniref:glutathione S-transferase family protein n=1 Tax=unclassified Corynebacterium TaxID=2624378 RepID=UPI00211C3523|nr:MULTISPECIES: glutathione S-transferase C-terminal domain-containing protein [unclassified Corynebacterium]MCQ9369957.1 glutathione S-transferase C-terminal domain-containing protein [Corynebacterium sp. 35RC1]MCQ9352076.1 glutathione S-transferase C-terminal domain-containing protein [Corynebacterium sp. 209RC1]MCQ9353825.1 glutathione S-transferase C-terminal domain-containing protein [Corynebacterium sp. 1222RC1]MCQ9356191.1 glutathione S-transferase C-terminal domain-containing protein [
MSNKASYIATGGEYVRDTQYITDRIVNSVSEPTPQEDGSFLWPVTPGRYRLIAARACPWAHRTVITRRLKGLEDVISLGLVGPTHDADSWTFDLDPGEVDPVLGIPKLKDAYLKRFPDYPRGITVPSIVDTTTGEIVSNDFPSIPKDFNDQWAAYEREGAPDLYPEALREEIDQVTKRVFTEVNNGVYRCGFAGTQEAYNDAYHRLWTTMDWLEERLSKQRYLVGEHITLADIYLYPTLIRFDAVYYSHFKASRNKITEMPALWGYLRDLFQTPGFGDTTDFTEIKQHYFIVHADINPTQIVPQGPDLSGLFTEHRREALGGTPFAQGVTLPSPIPAGEEVKNPIAGQVEFFS